MPSLLDLPQELIEDILEEAAYVLVKPARRSCPHACLIRQRLPAARQLPLICRSLCRLASQVVWRHLTLNHSCNTATEVLGLLSRLSRTDDYILAANEDRPVCIPSPASCVQSVCFKNFFRHGDSVSIVKVLHACHNVKALHISDGTFSMSPAMAEMLLERGPQIQSLVLSVDPHMLARVARIMPTGIDRMLQSLPNLTALSIHMGVATDMALSPMPWKHLRHVHLDNYTFSRDTVAELFQQNSRLDQIACYNEPCCSMWSDTIASLIPTQLKDNLTKFYFESCLCDFEPLSSFVSACHRLRSLTLVGSSTVEWVSQSAEALPPTLQELALCNLDISPFPVIDYISNKGIPKLCSVTCTFEPCNCFFDTRSKMWAFPLPRDFALPSLQEFTPEAKIKEDWSGILVLDMTHAALQKYAHKRGLEREKGPLLVEHFGFELDTI